MGGREVNLNLDNVNKYTIFRRRVVVFIGDFVCWSVGLSSKNFENWKIDFDILFIDKHMLVEQALSQKRRSHIVNYQRNPKFWQTQFKKGRGHVVKYR